MKAHRLLRNLNEGSRELTVAQKLLLKIEGMDESEILSEADLGSLVRLQKQLDLKQGGSAFSFPAGTLVAILPSGNKFSVANSFTKTTPDVLTGSASQAVVKKVMKVAKELGDLKKNKALIMKEFNPNLLAGPIGNLLRKGEDK